MLLRSCLSWATVRPRYSVSRTAFEFSKDFVSSATVASFCAMVTPYVYGRHADAGRRPRPPAPKAKTLRRKRTERDLDERLSMTPARAPAEQCFDPRARARR